MTQTTTFWWVRHAPVVGFDGRRYGALDVDCDTSDAPAFQALAALLPARGVLVTSALRRAMRTATALERAGFRAVERHADAALGEQSFGDWQGRPTAAVARAAAAAGAAHRHWIVDPAYTPPGGESFRALEARVMDAARRLLRRYPGQALVVVSHGGPIRAACLHGEGWSLERALALTIRNLSVTRIDGRLEAPGRDVWQVRWTGRLGTDHGQVA